MINLSALRIATAKAPYFLRGQTIELRLLSAGEVDRIADLVPGRPVSVVPDGQGGWVPKPPTPEESKQDDRRWRLVVAAQVMASSGAPIDGSLLGLATQLCETLSSEEILAAFRAMKKLAEADPFPNSSGPTPGPAPAPASPTASE